MPRSVIPDFGIEYPDYEYRAWPKYVGIDAEGNYLEAASEDEFRRLKEIAVFPKVLGKDRDGRDVVAHNPRDEQWLARNVVSGNALEEPLRRGPGRPPKVEAA